MEIDINNLPKSQEELEKIIVQLHRDFYDYKIKYADPLKEIRLAKQQRFSPSSEKNISQPDLFDEAGIAIYRK